MPWSADANPDTGALPLLTGDPQVVDAILREVRARTQVDLSVHRAATIRRRISNRICSVGAPSAESYLAFLRTQEQEAAQLLAHATIKVSRFYRNPAVFDLLRSQVLPTIDGGRRGALTIWCAGCARGEEAYTLAMLLEEAGIAGHVEATDVDPRAVADARAGVYAPEACADLPDPLAARFLEPVSIGPRGALRVREAVRRRVRFSVHDLTGDVPFAGPGSGFDLVSCRNVLIYFNRPTQERVLVALRRALSHDAFLLLGESEWPALALLPSLATYSAKARIFRAQDMGEES